MNLSGLQTFRAILDTGSLVKASEQLHVGQSTVTARLQTLESEIGQTLFRRDKSGVTLTAAGAKFRRYADTMVDLWRQAKQETSLPDGISAVINLGCHIDLWPITGQNLINKIRRDFPDTALSAWPGKNDELDDWMATGLVDAILTYRPSTHDRQTVYPLFSESLILVSTKADSPMRFDPDYVYVDAGEDFGRRHTAAYADAGIAKVSFGCASWGFDFLQAHGGSAYLPKPLVQPYLDDGTLYSIADAPEFTRDAFLVTNDEAAKSWQWLDSILSCLKTTNILTNN